MVKINAQRSSSEENGAGGGGEQVACLGQQQDVEPQSNYFGSRLIQDYAGLQDIAPPVSRLLYSQRVELQRCQTQTFEQPSYVIVSIKSFYRGPAYSGQALAELVPYKVVPHKHLAHK